MSKQTEKDNAYMETGSDLKVAVAKYVEAAREMDLDDQRIAEDVQDALHDAGIKIQRVELE